MKLTTTKKARKVNVEKLMSNQMNWHYTLSEYLQIIDWIFSFSQEYTESYSDRFKGSNKEGMHKLFFGYSANDHATTPYTLGENWLKELEVGLFRLFCTKEYSVVEQWKKDQRIGLHENRMIEIDYRKPCLVDDWNIFRAIYKILKYKDRAIKKEFAQPNCKDRTSPYIASINLTLCSYGFGVQYELGFKSPNCKKHFWTRFFPKNKGNNIDRYLSSVLDELKKIVDND